MVDDLLPPPTLEERLQSARTRFALLAEVLDLHALGIEHMDHALGPDAARALAETCRQAARGSPRTPRLSPGRATELVECEQNNETETATMSLMRTYRAALTLSQSAFAARLNVPLETYRTWDSGRREPSKEFLSRARTLAAHPDDTVLLSLRVLALMIGVFVSLDATIVANRCFDQRHQPTEHAVHQAFSLTSISTTSPCMRNRSAPRRFNSPSASMTSDSSRRVIGPVPDGALPGRSAGRAQQRQRVDHSDDRNH